ELLDKLKLMDPDETCLLDEVGGADRAGTKPQVGDGHRPRFLGIVDEISLGAMFCLLPDDFDRVLVGAHRSVRAEAVEDRLNAAGRFKIERAIPRKGRMAYITHNANREMVLRLRLGELIEDRAHHRRIIFL